jgi:ribosomal protein L37AE/L43A
MTYSCDECGEWVHSKRWELGYRTCRECGEANARAARASWCIAPAGHKQGYTRITDPQYLRNMNPKRVED